MPTIALPKVWNPGDVPAVTDVNADFAALLNAINGGLDVANLTGTPNLPASFTVGTAAVLTPAAPQILAPASFSGAIYNTSGGLITNSETIIAGGAKAGGNAPNQACIIPANALAVGRFLRFKIWGTCACGSAYTLTLRLRIGAAGTVADTTIVTWTNTMGAANSTAPWEAEVLLPIGSIGAAASFTANAPLVRYSQQASSLNFAAAAAGCFADPTIATTWNSTINNYFTLTGQISNVLTTTTFLGGALEIP